MPVWLIRNLIQRLALILLLIAPSWAGAGNYLCIADEATGFKTIGGTFKATAIIAGDKYIVSEDDGTVTKFGQTTPIFSGCVNSDASISCGIGLGEWLLGKKQMRFMHYAISWGFPFGFEDVPYIEIGTCSKF